MNKQSELKRNDPQPLLYVLTYRNNLLLAIFIIANKTMAKVVSFKGKESLYLLIPKNLTFQESFIQNYVVYKSVLTTAPN